MKSKKSRSSVFLIVSILLPLLTGCSAINPFVEPRMTRPDMKWEKISGSYEPIVDKNGFFQPQNVTVARVRLYARALQDAYRAAAAGQIKARVGLDATKIGTAGTALAIAATGGDAKTAGLLGLGAGALALGEDRFLITTRKRIWLQGAQALECVIGAANTFQVISPDIILLESELLALENTNQALETDITSFKTELDKPENIKPLPLIDDVLILAENTYQSADAFIVRVNETTDRLYPLGQILLSKIREIRLKVEAEIVKTEPDRLSYNNALKSILSQTPGGFISQARLDETLPQVDERDKEKLSSPLENGYTQAFKKAFDRMRRTTGKVLKAQQEVLSKLKQAVASGGVSYPDDLFSNCELNKNFGIASLTVTPSTQLKIQAGITSVVNAKIDGGTPPYSIDQKALPDGTTATIGKGNIVSLLLPEKVAIAGAHLAVPVTDSTSETTYLIIGFSNKPVEKNNGSKTTPPSPVKEKDEKADIEKIQKHLEAVPINPPYNLGPGGVDGQWGEYTKKAIIKYLTDNKADLTEEDIKKLFPDLEDTSTLNLDNASKEQLIKLISTII